jgi:hypothetical protein
MSATNKKKNNFVFVRPFCEDLKSMLTVHRPMWYAMNDNCDTKFS